MMLPIESNYIPKKYYALVAKICVTKLVYPEENYLSNLVSSVNNISDINMYLDTLVKRKHYSIFGTLYYTTENPKYFGKYKCFKLNNNLYAITLRHILEENPNGFSLSTFSDIDFNLDFTKLSRHVYVVYEDEIQLSVLFVGVSRVFTHQLVRHTIFNFMQVSNRYTTIEKEIFRYLDDLISDNPFLNLELIQLMQESLSIYRTLLNSGIRKEYARYVAPMGTPTVIFVNGLKEHWYKLLETRLKDASQYEFKKLVYPIAKYLHYSN